MTGLTVFIEKTPDGEIKFQSAIGANEDATEIEKRLLGCVAVALRACVLQVAGHYKAREKITHDDVSQRAAEVLQGEFEKLQQSGKSPFGD